MNDVRIVNIKENETNIIRMEEWGESILVYVNDTYFFTEVAGFDSSKNRCHVESNFNLHGKLKYLNDKEEVDHTDHFYEFIPNKGIEILVVDYR